jgi:DNA end-binding protein Ku
VRDDVIVMQTMMWPDEIRQPDFGAVDIEDAKPAEVKMANMLVETLAGDFVPDEFEDDYREAVEALVKAKIEGGEIKAAPKPAKTGGEVVDLLAALQRSVDAAKSARGESEAEEVVQTSTTTKGTPRKTTKTAATAASSAPRATKKTSAKKTPAKTTKKTAKKAS